MQHIYIDSSLLAELPGVLQYATNPSYVQLGDEMGYVFLQDAKVRVLRDLRENQQEALTISIEHGAQPLDASYAYVLLPKRERAQTAAYAEAPEVEILAQTPAMHAVRHIPSGKIAANLFEPGQELCGIVFDQPCSVMMTIEGTRYHIYLSDPTQTKGRSITLTFSEAVRLIEAEEGISANENSITVETWRQYGNTFHFIAEEGA